MKDIENIIRDYRGRAETLDRSLSHFFGHKDLSNYHGNRDDSFLALAVEILRKREVISPAESPEFESFIGAVHLAATIEEERERQRNAEEENEEREAEEEEPREIAPRNITKDETPAGEATEVITTINNMISNWAATTS